MATKKNRNDKSETIRYPPVDLPATDVVAKAKSEGLAMAPGPVHKARGPSKAKGSASKEGAKKRSSASNGTSTKSAMTKADFVRAHGQLSPLEIVEKAKAAGTKLGLSYIYNVRSTDKSARKKKTRSKSTPSVPPAANRHRAVSAAKSSEEELLVIVAAEIGLGRSIEILAGERARVRAVLGV